MTDIYPIIGMSPGNGYFKDAVVRKLLQKVVSQFGKTVIFVADIPAISTYIALGYPENRARRDKALPQGNNLKNKVRKAMVELGYTDAQVQIIDWQKDIQENPDYKNKYSEILQLYNSNTLFKKAANEATKEVLEHTGKPVQNFDDAITIAVDYLLSEFAFMEYAPHYLDAKKVVYVYHREWPVYQSYIKGEFDGIIREKLDYLTVTTD